MKTIEVKMQLPELPDGYEYTGEVRVPLNGELYCRMLTYDKRVERVHTSAGTLFDMYPIVRRVEKWRPATFSDLGKNLQARFGDSEPLRHTSTLCGWTKHGEFDDWNWLDANGAGWRSCEVLESTP